MQRSSRTWLSVASGRAAPSSLQPTNSTRLSAAPSSARFERSHPSKRMSLNCALCSRQSVKVTLRKRQLCQRACSAASGPTVPRSTLRSVQSSACCDRMPASTGSMASSRSAAGQATVFFFVGFIVSPFDFGDAVRAQVGVGAAEMAAAEEPPVGRPGRGVRRREHEMAFGIDQRRLLLRGCAPKQEN